MKVVRFDRSQDIPIIDAFIRGTNQSGHARLVFDTGSGLTQLDTILMEELGFSAKDGINAYQTKGPAGEALSGYKVEVKALSLFGRRIDNLVVGVIDFDNFSHYGISGLLGFDVIKDLHLEVDGPNGLMTVF